MRIKRVSVLAAAVLATSMVAAVPVAHSASPPRIIIDSDIALWWDDVSAFAIANAASNQGDVKYLGAVADVKSADAAPAIDAINTWYGNGDIPVGATLGAEQNIFANVYTTALARRFRHSRGRAPDAVAVYRRLLERQPDHSVTVVSLGGHTNLAALLASDRGKGARLVARKVRQLVVMAGEFPTASRAWTNELIDVPATRYVFNTGWPKSVPITWVDAKIGFPLFVGQTVTRAHRDGPIRAAFEILFPDGKVDDANWDAIAIYYAIYGLGDNVLSLAGAGGAASVNEVGAISWVANPDRPKDRYLQVPSYPKLAATLDALIDYVPRAHRPRR